MPDENRTDTPAAAGASGLVGVGRTAATVLVLASAWLAAGSCGLLAHALRHALTLTLLGAALAAGWPRGGAGGRGLWLWLSAAAAVALTAVDQAPVNALAAPILALGLAAAADTGRSRRLLRAAAGVTFAFAVYRVLVTAAPPLWQAADAAGALAGRIAGVLARRPLNVGATFGGVDFLVLMAGWWAAWLGAAARPVRSRAVYGAIAILAAHLVYLYVLAHAADILARLPPFDAKVDEPFFHSFLRAAVPWNLPLLALCLHGAVAAATIAWTSWPDAAPAVTPGRRAAAARLAGAMAAGAALGLLTTMVWGSLTLQGKKIVFYEKGFLNWLKPKHEDYGRLSIGMYGLLPPFVESFGARCTVSPDLSEADLRDADVLVTLYPDKPWTTGQVERVEAFVRRGGSLCVVGDHTVREADGGSRFNDLLRPTNMRVQFDCANFAVGGWLQSYETLAHPATMGLGDTRNELGIVIGASVRARFPARPVIVGRWGWSDWGDEGGNAMIGNHAYDAGERLGDLVLVAEQPLGRGRIMAFGDTSSFSNGINMGSHLFTSRLLAHLASRADGPPSAWRWPAELAAALALLVLLARGGRPAELAAALVALAMAREAGAAATHRAAELRPAPAPGAAYGLAYIDESHLGRFSGESWRDDGLMGLALNLMRNGYLTLLMHDFSAERLARANLFVSVAPARPYTEAEARAIRRFVEAGGLAVLTVGFDERPQSLALLRELGFDIAGGAAADDTARHPRPLGFFKSPYTKTDAYLSYVRFHAVWPVHSDAADARPLAYGRGDLPAIMMRPIGRGKVVVVGDASFALNKNLEVESGTPFEGMRENPHFWRWLLTWLRGETTWQPPDERLPAGQEGAP